MKWVIGIIAVLVIAWLLSRRSSRPTQPRPMPYAPQPTGNPWGSADASSTTHEGPVGPLAIAFGYLISWPTAYGQEYRVNGIITYTEGGVTWHEYRLQPEGGVEYYLSVETERGINTVLWTAMRTTNLTPGGRQIVSDGITYDLVERGTARYHALGQVGLPSGGNVKYYDYRTSDGSRFLSFESFDGGQWEVSSGEPIGWNTLAVRPPA